MYRCATLICAATWPFFTRKTLSSRGLPALGLKTFSFDSNCLAEVQPLWKPRLLLGPPGQQYLKFLDGWNVDAGVGGWVGG